MKVQKDQEITGFYCVRKAAMAGEDTGQHYHKGHLLTKDQFRRAFAVDQNIPLDELEALGLEPQCCECSADCDTWQMITSAER